MFVGEIAKILGVSTDRLNNLEEEMVKAGYPAALDQIEKENAEAVERALKDLAITASTISSPAVREKLAGLIERHENELYEYVGVSPDNFDFEKIAQAAEEIASEKKGFFLKKDYAREILLKRPPRNTMADLGYTSVEDLLEKEDVGEIFSALRFTESDAWMHETFRTAYSNFSPDDFEERQIELKVLGDQWKEIAQKYVAKKRHNVSHLKEFGVIFLNPIAQTGKGKFLRDFALLLHYFHEIVFYSRLFKKYSAAPDFNKKFISLLRGDVLEKQDVKPAEWLIVQRYLWKENPDDPRLFLPRVNPEAVHWHRGQEDLVAFSKNNHVGLHFWENLDSAAALFNGELISFELEDNAMAVAGNNDGKKHVFFYHQREALWNKIFAKYVGGEEKMYELILDNMDKGSILLSKSQ
jgi:hypothetical protein